MSAGGAMRAAVEGVGESIAPRKILPLVRDLGVANADIAALAGYGRARDHARGTEGWRRRQSFMRNLQRYGKEGGQTRTARGASLDRLRVAAVLLAMVAAGTTSTLVRVRFDYSSRKNPTRPPRTIEARVYVSPGQYEEADWPLSVHVPPSAEEWDELARTYVSLWATAYGMPPEVSSPQAAEEETEFSFVLGREEPITYEYEG